MSVIIRRMSRFFFHARQFMRSPDASVAEASKSHLLTVPENDAAGARLALYLMDFHARTFAAIKRAK